MVNAVDQQMNFEDQVMSEDVKPTNEPPFYLMRQAPGSLILK